MKHLLTLLFLCSCSAVVRPIAGDFKGEPQKTAEQISPAAVALVDKSFEGINLTCLKDFHVHAVGTGKGNTGAWVNPHMTSPLSPYNYLRYKVYMSASGVSDEDKADQQFLERLTDLASADKRYGKLNIFAFDYNHNQAGQKIKELSSFYIPNQYVWKIAQENPTLYEPVISVHPYRKDALEQIHKWGKRGVKFIKWLPNAMGIHPGKQRLRPFYEAVKKYDMAIITHTGHEKAVEGEEFQELGNPLHLRMPLELGVKVVMAHVASLGTCADTDNGGEQVSCFELFWRLFKEKKYEKNLFGEISGVTIYTRVSRPIDLLLEHPELHHRLVNGSDYPLPAINILYRTSQMRKLGYITEKEEQLLNEIYSYNPLLFDFVMKRTLKHPKTAQKYQASAFEVPTALGCHSL